MSTQAQVSGFLTTTVELFQTITEHATRGVETLGMLILTGGILYALFAFFRALRHEKDRAYYRLKHNLGKSIIVGLEVLVAADILATVTSDTTPERVQTLAIIILVRILLSFAIHVELEEKLPWQKDRERSSRLPDGRHQR